LFTPKGFDRSNLSFLAYFHHWRPDFFMFMRACLYYAFQEGEGWIDILQVGRTMPGFDINDPRIQDAKEILGQLMKDRVKLPFGNQKAAEPEWSIWSQQQNQGKVSQPGQPGALRDTMPAPPTPARDTTPALRPEQMVGTNRADEATKQSVYQAVDQARRQSNRTVAAGQFMQAIAIANSSSDASLQAVSKVEYGLANLNWGFSEEGFKWLLEAGSNNPSLYDKNTNQAFLSRLAQAGMPRSAVDLLMNNGSQDPTWYLKDAQATRKLDAAMTGAVFVSPGGGSELNQNVRAGDPLAPPVPKPEMLNPNVMQQPAEASPWMKEQVMTSLQSALKETNHQNAFGLFKQATDLADRSGDKTMQSTARIETGLALISWGNTESGFKWLLSAGSINPSLYDSQVNQALQQRMRQGGISEAALDMFLKNGRQNPEWHTRKSDAAQTLASVQASGNNPNFRPSENSGNNPGGIRGSRPGQDNYLPIPNIFPLTTPPDSQTQPKPHVKPNPFGG
jgi:hypothetical protein